eukprot:TRINITY_DN22165_c0_g1_i1.p1 TRINITY_DN22165_c0_g1~~TRINITY_DN22165_c0_g1_i1.p1  ORF type:complete len:870 (+),score=189.21 TRINITY_DN22165_c0_g1_i1:58-2667(+)
MSASWLDPDEAEAFSERADAQEQAAYTYKQRVSAGDFSMRDFFTGANVVVDNRYFTGQWFSHRDEYVPSDISQDASATMTVTFQPGMLGIGRDEDEVVELQPGGQGSEAGVEPGMRYFKVNGRPFTEAALQACTSGRQAFEVTFFVPQKVLREREAQSKRGDVAWLSGARKDAVGGARILKPSEKAAKEADRLEAEQKAFVEFPIELDRTGGEKIGVVLSKVDEFRVTRMEGDGLIKAWNARHPLRKVDVDDVFMSVNGVEGDSAAMLAQLKEAQPLNIVVRRNNKNASDRIEFMVAGAGGKGAAVNGHYRKVGKVNDKPKYQKVGGHAIIYFDEFWKMFTKDDVNGWFYAVEPEDDEDFEPSEEPPTGYGLWSNYGYTGGDAHPYPFVEKVDIKMNPDNKTYGIDLDAFTQPPKRGVEDRFYCGMKVGPEGYCNGQRRFCKENNNGTCECDGLCGPWTGCQCRRCYLATFPEEEKTLFANAALDIGHRKPTVSDTAVLQDPLAAEGFEKLRAVLMNPEAAAALAARVANTLDANSCLHRTPKVGERVYRKTGVGVATALDGTLNGFRLCEQERATVIEVDADGDFRLQNYDGIVSDWVMRKNYFFDELPAPRGRSAFGQGCLDVDDPETGSQASTASTVSGWRRFIPWLRNTKGQAADDDEGSSLLPRQGSSSSSQPGCGVDAMDGLQYSTHSPGGPSDGASSSALVERAERAEAQVVSLRRQLERSLQSERQLTKENENLRDEVARLQAEMREMDQERTAQTRSVSWLNADSAEKFANAVEAAAAARAKAIITPSSKIDAPNTAALLGARALGPGGWEQEVLQQVFREKMPYEMPADMSPPQKRRPAWLDEDSVLSYTQDVHGEEED